MIIVLCQMLIYSLHDKPYRNILLTIAAKNTSLLTFSKSRII